jgi:hypothetical protein
MTELKTKPTGEDVEQFLNAIPDAKKRKDSLALLALMREATGMEGKVWRGGIVGFGDVHYKYPSGHEGDTAMIGFAPRKQNLTLYLLSGFDGHEQVLARLGKHKIGKGCLYINKLEDVHLSVLRELIQSSVERTRQSSLWQITSEG